GVDLTEQCRIPVDDPARDLFVAVPRGVLDEHTGVVGRVVGGRSHGLIVSGVDLDHFGTLTADRGDGVGVDASGGHEDAGRVPGLAGEARHRPAVVAIGGGDHLGVGV